MNTVPPQTAPQPAPQTPRFGMVVDINRCVGCQTCTISCKHANDTPPGMQWRKVLDVERGEFPDVERLFLVVGCQHCAEPSCVPVCPTGATAQRADGLVTMDYDLCIGCGYCAVACPYQARTIVHNKDWYYGEPTVQEEQTYHDERLGVANKCTFCIERIDEAAAIGATPGIDLDHTPACASSCISQAIRFGDFANPDSIVSKLAADNNYFQMHAELGNDPQIKYLYEVPGATPGRDPDPQDLSDEVMSDPENPLVGARQGFWDYRAAMNFTLGGMTSGLVIIAYLAHLTGLLHAGALPLLNAMAAIGMAVGLFFVFLEIGRKLRFLNVLLRPQSSWMTRETYFVVLFYPTVAADLIWPHGLLHLLAALAAAGFLYSQARILQAGKGIPAWRHPRIPLMLVATGLFEGVGLLALITLIDPPLFAIGKPLAAAGIVLALVNAGLWRSYMKSAKKEGIGPLARAVLTRLTPILHTVGHLIPVFLMAFPWSRSAEPSVELFALAGAAAVIGGVMWKFAVITRACHQQGYAVPKMPQRGSGNRAAPARLNTV
jgi:phenylacetyl-CoA:acceptor oxidoreductase 27-kDa subunit